MLEWAQAACEQAMTRVKKGRQACAPAVKVDSDCIRPGDPPVANSPLLCHSYKEEKKAHGGNVPHAGKQGRVGPMREPEEEHEDGADHGAEGMHGAALCVPRANLLVVLVALEHFGREDGGLLDAFLEYPAEARFVSRQCEQSQAGTVAAKTDRFDFLWNVSSVHGGRCMDPHACECWRRCPAPFGGDSCWAIPSKPPQHRGIPP